MKKKSIIIVAVLIILAAAIYFLPPLFLPDAQWDGSDDAGSEMVSEILGVEYDPWFEPVIESIIGDELSEGMETLLFVFQAAIGAVVLIICFVYLGKKRKTAGGEATV